MSDILIRGMEMPTEDEEIIIRISPDGTVMTEYALPITGVKAVPVPPHGRLIDADEFKLYLAEMLFKYAPAFKTEKYAHFAVQLTEAIASDIDEAPAIIPAEEGKKK